jgi:hypothetical protein
MEYLKEFTKAIHSLSKVKVTFKAKKYSNMEITRICAPMDYSSGKIDNYKTERYQVWDFQGGSKPHPESLLESQIISIQILPEYFKPESFVTWEAPFNWSIKRDWGSFS